MALDFTNAIPLNQENNISTNQSNNNNLQSSTSSNYKNWHQFTTSAGPTNYALKIRSYKAQAPQDANFAVIQFEDLQ